MKGKMKDIFVNGRSFGFSLSTNDIKKSGWVQFYITIKKDILYNEVTCYSSGEVVMSTNQPTTLCKILIWLRFIK